MDDMVGSFWGHSEQPCPFATLLAGERINESTGEILLTR